MDSKRIAQIKSQFDLVVHTNDEFHIEFWYARELMPLLGYERWNNFENVILRAMDSCEASGINVSHHFRDVAKMIRTGKGAQRPVRDFMLTRYACYLIAQNGDPKKEEIAFAQGYFAFQTRKQELIEERVALIERTEARGRLRESEKRLSQNIYERGVDDTGFARIRSKGDQALFGGHTTSDMKERLGVKENRPLADFLPTLTIAAKNLAACRGHQEIGTSGQIAGKEISRAVWKTPRVSRKIKTAPAPRSGFLSNLIVTLAGHHIDDTIFLIIDNAVGVVDSPAPYSAQIPFQRLWLPDSLKGVSPDFLQQRVDSLQGLFVLGLPV